MPENNETNKPLPVLRKIFEIQEKQQQKKIEQCVYYLVKQQVPTPDDIRETINSLVGETRQHVLRHHIFGQENSTGVMRYHVESLIDSGKWNDRSLGFISTLHGEKVQLSAIVRKHFGLLNDLVREVNNVFAKSVTPAEKDFFDIEDSYKRQ